MNNVYDAVKAASFVPVLNRKLVWKGGTVSMMVPAYALEDKFPSPDGSVRYVWFAQNVGGGVVNFFVHGKKPGQLRGKKIVANAEVWQKTLADGRKYLYVNLLHPRPSSETTPTHRLVTIAVEKKGLKIDGLSIAFETPTPLTGTIVVAPIGSKVIINAPPAVPKPAEPVRANVTDIRPLPAVASRPATPAMLERLAVKYNGCR